MEAVLGLDDVMADGSCASLGDTSEAAESATSSEALLLRGHTHSVSADDEARSFLCAVRCHVTATKTFVYCPAVLCVTARSLGCLRGVQDEWIQSDSSDADIGAGARPARVRRRWVVEESSLDSQPVSAKRGRKTRPKSTSAAPLAQSGSRPANYGNMQHMLLVRAALLALPHSALNILSLCALTGDVPPPGGTRSVLLDAEGHPKLDGLTASEALLARLHTDLMGFWAPLAASVVRRGHCVCILQRQRGGDLVVACGVADGATAAAVPIGATITLREPARGGSGPELLHRGQLERILFDLSALKTALRQ